MTTLKRGAALLIPGYSVLDDSGVLEKGFNFQPLP
jgi:hypothetical protein